MTWFDDSPQGYNRNMHLVTRYPYAGETPMVPYNPDRETAQLLMQAVKASKAKNSAGDAAKNGGSDQNAASEQPSSAGHQSARYQKPSPDASGYTPPHEYGNGDSFKKKSKRRSQSADSVGPTNEEIKANEYDSLRPGLEFPRMLEIQGQTNHNIFDAGYESMPPQYQPAEYEQMQPGQLEAEQMQAQRKRGGQVGSEGMPSNPDVATYASFGGNGEPMVYLPNGQSCTVSLYNQMVRQGLIIQPAATHPKGAHPPATHPSGGPLPPGAHEEPPVMTAEQYLEKCKRDARERALTQFSDESGKPSSQAGQQEPPFVASFDDQSKTESSGKQRQR